MRAPSPRAWLAALIGVVASASCLLTSDLDGLTGNDTTSASSSTGAAAGGGGALGSGGSGTGASSPSGGGGAHAGGGAGTGGAPCGTHGINGAFPATCVLDDFNRADGMPGISWLDNDPQAYAIQSNQLVTTQYNENDAGVSNPDTILWSDIFGPTQEIFVTVAAFDPADGEIELLLKAQGGAQECDSIEVDYQPGSLHAYKCEQDGNGFVQLSPSPVALVLHPGDQLGARAFPDGHLEGFVNGVLVQTWDTTPYGAYASSGRVGIYSSGVHGRVAYDDFGGGGE